MRFRLVLLGTGALSLAATLAVALAPGLRFAYRSPSLHLVLETAATLIALLAGYLAVGRFRQEGRPSDLLLGAALAASTLSSLVVALLPEISAQATLPDAAAWLSLAGALLAAALWAAAAVVPDRPVRDRAAAGRRAASAFVLGVAFLGTLVLVVLGGRPTGIPLRLAPTDTARPLLVGSPLMIGGLVASAVLFCVAVAGFARRALTRQDELVRWLAAATVLGAFSRVNYVLFPSRYSEWVYVGDLFRIAFYVALIVGAFREIRGYWARVAEAAVLEERRRLARELHDGLAQELAFVAAEAGGRVAAAARRALDESRLAIAALSQPLGEPVELAVVRAAEEVAHRHGVRVRCDVEHVEVSAELRDALLRIAREAVGNAARHGTPNVISVSLHDGSLRVADDGCGFDPAVVRGFGLVSMRERAGAAGARLLVESAPGRGSSVAVAWP